MTVTQSITTAEQLLQAPDLGRCELVRGELAMMSPAGFRHGWIAIRLGARLERFVEQNHLGAVTTAETGFQIEHDPDTVRAPDAAFVRAERVPAVQPEGYFQGAPDLAVEVVSPSDRPGAVSSKAREWLSAGCRAVWVVDPQTETVSVYQAAREILVLRRPDDLEGGEVLPGFRLPVAEIFAR
jgi:Uma2 family endonuclease